MTNNTKITDNHELLEKIINDLCFKHYENDNCDITVENLDYNQIINLEILNLAIENILIFVTNIMVCYCNICKFSDNITPDAIEIINKMNDNLMKAYYSPYTKIYEILYDSFLINNNIDLDSKKYGFQRGGGEDENDEEENSNSIIRIILGKFNFDNKSKKRIKLSEYIKSLRIDNKPIFHKDNLEFVKCLSLICDSKDSDSLLIDTSTKIEKLKKQINKLPLNKQQSGDDGDDVASDEEDKKEDKDDEGATGGYFQENNKNRIFFKKNINLFKTGGADGDDDESKNQEDDESKKQEDDESKTNYRKIYRL